MKLLFLKVNKTKMAFYIHGTKKWRKMREDFPIVPYLGRWKSDVYDKNEEYLGVVYGFYCFPFAFRITKTTDIEKGTEVIFK